MKSPTAYYLMLLYITVMIKPLIPYFQDTLAHEYNGIEHVLKVHAKYGMNHLQKELDENNADSNSKESNTAKSQELVAFHIQTPAGDYNAVYSYALLQHRFFTPRFLPLVCLLTEAPPPKYC